ncbi:4-alpha-glucanotransferase [Cellulomonas sp. zg-ZUI222]|uniref:4-alpha-glucanotransferase n=1 Tax=Cellulomonas wangleii TaxID=2816956 RepID=A0ABX8DAN4_9CELL|nr:MULTISPECIES: 4-alpha-glucanotransferase [Cellulomonas]MBO0900838.1 4-alpha-glucanotransferase [Cellulomonas sp. zg-ZUI22]MBO0921502.1 4-alpha-glucanotransferase [Cellulomonas wangleii]MBO0924998.1 4-alpha-glucanotransferase [Cellulomonas wangleii]QVI63581.1 4-alpha-glucanotransferase [Cellulomonas wangleii]
MPHTTLHEDLWRLAAAYDVVPAYRGHDGNDHEASDETVIRVLGALGVDASTPERVALALDHVENMPWRRVLPPVVVLRQGSSVNVPVHVTHGDPVEVWLELDPEVGGGRREVVQVDVVVEPRQVDGRLVGRATFALPDDLPLGWHEIRAEGPSAHAHSPVVVTPERLELPERLRDGAVWGVMAQLYSVRSRTSWGVGDLADLAELGWLAAHRWHADFLLVNPLHAAEPVEPLTPSPYLPTTRRFVNPLYIRVEDVRETAYLSAADRALVEWAAEPVLALDTDPGPVDRDAAWAAKRAALEVVFGHPRSVARQAEFDAFVEEQGEGLREFALWCALVERYGPVSGWSDDLRDPLSDAVAAAAVELADRVVFWSWLQWVADEQLERAQRVVREGGMALGIMHDLAVGVHPEGADAWALRDVLATGASVGAPPDMYNQQGQDWSQPPWHPDALARAAYRPYRDMLRTVLRHAGAIRIDHVLGLFRLWWVPVGNSPRDGAYVRYDHDALVGILALEAHRAGAVVIGEDLGTVEPWVSDYLSERGILGTSVLWFEQEHDGRPRPPESYRRLALATVTTHDLPPTAGYLAEEHVTLRDRLGLLSTPVEQVRAEAAAERERMLSALRERGLLGHDPSEREIVEALHRWVAATPAVLLGVSLADAVGERRAQNQPGTDREYPNWKVPLADGTGQVVLLEDLFTNARAQSLADAMGE